MFYAGISGLRVDRLGLVQFLYFWLVAMWSFLTFFSRSKFLCITTSSFKFILHSQVVRLFISTGYSTYIHGYTLLYPLILTTTPFPFTSFYSPSPTFCCRFYPHPHPNCRFRFPSFPSQNNSFLYPRANAFFTSTQLKVA